MEIARTASFGLLGTCSRLLGLKIADVGGAVAALDRF